MNTWCLDDETDFSFWDFSVMMNAFNENNYFFVIYREYEPF